VKLVQKLVGLKGQQNAFIGSLYVLPDAAMGSSFDLECLDDSLGGNVTVRLVGSLWRTGGVRVGWVAGRPGLVRHGPSVKAAREVPAAGRRVPGCASDHHPVGAGAGKRTPRRRARWTRPYRGAKRFLCGATRQKWPGL